VRLGVYSDLVYHSDGESISTDRSFIRFISALAAYVDELVIFGRLDPAPGRDLYVLPREGVRFVPLPHYRSVFSVVQLTGAIPRSCRVFVRELQQLDAVWVFGPAPLAVLFARIARRHRVRLFLGVRQDYPRYIGNRLPSRRWIWALGAAHVLDLAFRRIARRAPTVAVGEELAQHYSRGQAPVLATGLSLIEADEVVPLRDALARSWQGELRLLSVGRLDPEKNPRLLLDVIEILRRRDPRWRLAIVGDGPMAEQLADTMRERGLEEAVELVGVVANGPELWQWFRSSHAFLHVSLTEGLPQVLFEAEAAGLPIVATDVGGVASALGQGERGLLVGPRNAEAAAQALERLETDEGLRRRLITAGLAHASKETLGAQLERVASFLGLGAS
jgi:glycosyltransferase involved in cell wall biosynthesis